MLFKPPDSRLDNRIATIAESVSKLTISIETMAVEHKRLSQDQGSLEKRIDKNEHDLQDLREVKTQIGLITRTVQWGGIALIGGVLFSWNNLAAKVDIGMGKTDLNSQAVLQLTKENIDEQKQIEELRAKVISNREAIVTNLKSNPKHLD